MAWRDGGSKPVRFKLDPARLLEPFRQGDGDSLCGLYAIINCLRLALEPLRPLSDLDTQNLFNSGYRFLAAEEILAEAMEEGIGYRLWRQLGNHLHAEASKLVGLRTMQRRLLSGRRCVTFDVMLDEMEQRLVRGQPSILCMAEGEGHYTVVCGYSASNVILFDSYDHRWIKKASCSVASTKSEARHQLDPAALHVTVVGG